MNFFNLKRDNLAIVTKERSYTYQEIPLYEFFSNRKELILILCDNSIRSISAYIHGMNSQHAVMLLTADMNKELLKKIIERYMPKWMIGLENWEGYIYKDYMLERVQLGDCKIHPDLAVLLSTSGTTGSQKFVRLSYENLVANARSIVEYLEIGEAERAIMNLPLSYSYGMSIVNSHLTAGAAIVLTDDSVIEKSFWDFIKESKATSIPGVPYTYQLLHRVGFTKMDLPDLKVMTQAGGRLNEKLVKTFAQFAKDQNKRFYVMYGQTEAAPRISYIPYDRTIDKSETIGIAIPDGQLSINSETSELIYKGPNVMMGYAESIEDLAKGDIIGGVLHTGDTAVMDEDGYFSITGRLKRFIKLFGLRINLDEVEKKLEAKFNIPLACTGSDDKLVVAIEIGSNKAEVEQAIEKLYNLHRTAFKVKVVKLPHLVNGKTDYVKLKEICL